MTLRQVISALSDKESHYVPYRDSKLTTILRQSLGGNSYTLMIACLTPLDEFTDENLSTLNYAARAQKIHNVPHINIDPKTQTISEQRETIVKLHEELMRTNEHIKFLTQGVCVCKQCDFH
jgi:kinesin family protein 4/21/27